MSQSSQPNQIQQNTPSTNTRNSRSRSAVRKRMVLYARVSTQEQAKGQFPSCDSQIEELETFCKSQGWDIAERIKDEGHRAGTLRRPGLSRLRWLVETEQIEGVICTWYNRLIGSRDFYILDKEFKAHNVAFVTVHDPADRNTASGRLLESMLVTIKTFENEQVAEKVRTKMRQRAEKGLWNGGPVPLGFRYDAGKQTIDLDPEKTELVNQLFQIYVETASDFAVRDWLKAHGIPSPSGQAVWRPSTLCKLLTNRRYIGEVEINKTNKGIEGLSDFESYQVIPASHAAIVSRDVFDMAQAIRREKGAASPNRRGKPRDYSRNQCNRVFPLQGRLYCGCCGHAMSPYYVVHKPDQRRRKASYIYYYVCSNQMMRGKNGCGHSNRVLAKIAESWITERVADMAENQAILDEAFAAARMKYHRDLQPQREKLLLNQKALVENQAKIDKMMEAISASAITPDLLVMLNEKAGELRLERDRLRFETRKLQETLQPIDQQFDALPLQQMFARFSELAQAAEPSEMQRILRATVHQLVWQPSGEHFVDFYSLPQSGRKATEIGAGMIAKEGETNKVNQIRSTTPLAPAHLDLWLERNVRYGSP